MSEKAEVVLVSEAVAAQLSDASKAGILGSHTFNAKHWTLPRFTREDFESLIVTTRARGDARSFSARGVVQHDYLIEITVRKAVESDKSALADELILLAQKIADLWEKTDTTTGQTRVLAGRSERLIGPVETEFSDEELERHSLIKCVITLTFRGWR